MSCPDEFACAEVFEPQHAVEGQLVDVVYPRLLPAAVLFLLSGMEGVGRVVPLHRASLVLDLQSVPLVSQLILLLIAVEGLV